MLGQVLREHPLGGLGELALAAQGAPHEKTGARDICVGSSILQELPEPGLEHRPVAASRPIDVAWTVDDHQVVNGQRPQVLHLLCYRREDLVDGVAPSPAGLEPDHSFRPHD